MIIQTNSVGRFSLIFKTPSESTAVNLVSDSGNTTSQIWTSVNTNNQIIINYKDFHLDTKVIVYNALGQILIEKQLTQSVTILDNKLHSGVYTVCVYSGGKYKTNKVIIN